MLINEIRSDIYSIRDNKVLFDPLCFCERADTLDFIDFHVIDRIEALIEQYHVTEDLDLLMRQAQAVKQDLERINAELFSKIKKKIAEGDCRGDVFSEIIKTYTGYTSVTPDNHTKPDYDNLDFFVNGILLDNDLPEPDSPLKPEMVFYQQTPARVIFDLIKAVNINTNSIFYDLGSGLGHVPILMNLITGFKTVGVEYIPAYCNYAKNIASKLNIANVEFINADAADMTYSDATIVFLYTPFKGQTLQKVLEILKVRLLTKPLQIFSYGPCSIDISTQKWLTCLNGPATNINRLYEFTSR